MISVYHVLLNKSAIDITRSDFYRVNVTALSVNALSFTFRITYIGIFKNPYDQLDLPRVYSMVFTQLHYLVIYNILTFCTLVSITIVNFHLDGIFDALTIRMLMTHCFVYIRSQKKWIRTTLFLYIT